MITPDVCIELINRFLPEPHAGLLAGIVFGAKTSISTELYDALITTGTLHIAALSGMNITILTMVFFSTFIRVLPRMMSSILTVGVIVFFVFFVGPSPSVVRAAIMGSITLLAPLTGRIPTAIITWGIAIASMLCFDITLFGNISFQLSALAALGMILFSKRTTDTYGKEPTVIGWMKEELATTLSAQVFTIPLLLFVFGRISLISPITNLFIGWTIPIITVLGLCISLFGFVWFPLGQMVAWISWVFLEWLIQIIMVTSRVPFASIGR